MSEISRLTGNKRDAANFSGIAHGYINKWQQLAVVEDANPPHTNLHYQDSNSYGMKVSNS